MNELYNKKSVWYCFVLLLCFAFNSNSQVTYLTNLTGGTTEICTGSYRKIAVSVARGTCTAFAGNVNSVSFDWQVESSPGVWVSKDSYFVPGVTYSVEKRINSNGNVITSILTVTTTDGTPEVTLKYRVSAQGSGGCPAVTSGTESIAIKYYRWTGAVSNVWTDPANWNCNKMPASTSVAVVPSAANPAVISSAVILKDIIVETGGNLTISSGSKITVNGPVNVQGTGSFTLQNNANLIQSTYTGANTGVIKVNRNSSALMRLDYSLWSSPVVNQNLLAFSPATSTNRFYTYDSPTNVYAAIAPSTNAFQLGKGYLIRMPNNWITTPAIWNGVFTGIPNNGNISLTTSNGGVGKRINGIGNPYPSPVKMTNFVNGNFGKITGTLYFWRKSNSTVTEPGYCTWTTAGFVSNGEAQVVNPNGILQTGQGFLVEMLSNYTTVVFNNTMRVADFANQFFKGDSAEDVYLNGDKFKLNVISSEGYRNQMLLGYFDQATLDVDYGIDGKAIDNHPLSLTMELNKEDYYVQGRPHFNDADVVALKFKTETAGEFTVSTEELIGVFEKEQNIFLNDKFTNKVHNFKNGDYKFVSGAGTFENRFELIYKDTDVKQISENESTNIVVYKNNGQLVVKSDNDLNTVKIFDLRGRLLKEARTISQSEYITPIDAQNEVLLVQITTNDGTVFNKKIVF